MTGAAHLLQFVSKTQRLRGIVASQVLPHNMIFHQSSQFFLTQRILKITSRQNALLHVYTGLYTMHSHIKMFLQSSLVLEDKIYYYTCRMYSNKNLQPSTWAFRRRISSKEFTCATKKYTYTIFLKIYIATRHVCT
jgi:hypothetical protein